MEKDRLFFLEGKGLIKGWALLAEVLHGMDFKMNTEEKRQNHEVKIQRKKENSREGLCGGNEVWRSQAGHSVAGCQRLYAGVGKSWETC